MPQILCPAHVSTTTDKWESLKSKNVWGPCAVMVGEVRDSVCSYYYICTALSSIV
jgi:hypothetical protein